MSMPICRFCDSGVPWNNCSCTFAKAATITGHADAQKRFLASGGTLQPKPGAGAESARSPVNREATAESSEAAQSRERKKRGRTAGSIPATGAKPLVGVASAREETPTGRPERFIGAGPAGERPAHSPVEGRFAPPGTCGWCDKERTRNAERVQKHRRAKQKDQEG